MNLIKPQAHQFIGNTENRFELVKRHQGYAIDKIKNVRNFTGTNDLLL